MEKCYGVAKAGKNDCQTATSSCAGTPSVDGQADTWVFLPKGSCEKIVDGSLDELDPRHRDRLDDLIRRYQPGLLSEHLSWSSVGGTHSNDLLPLPYTEGALAQFAGCVRQVQDRLGRRILVENPSSYLRFRHSTIEEWAFPVAVAERSDCGLLLNEADKAQRLMERADAIAA